MVTKKSGIVQLFNCAKDSSAESGVRESTLPRLEAERMKDQENLNEQHSHPTTKDEQVSISARGDPSSSRTPDLREASVGDRPAEIFLTSSVENPRRLSPEGTVQLLHRYVDEVATTSNELDCRLEGVENLSNETLTSILQKLNERQLSVFMYRQVIRVCFSVDKGKDYPQNTAGALALDRFIRFLAETGEFPEISTGTFYPPQLAGGI